MKNINTLRNQLSSNLRKVVLELHKEKKAFSAKMLLRVITRNPKLLLLKPTKAPEGKTIPEATLAKNEEANLANERLRDRLFIYLDRLLPATSLHGMWGVEQRTKHMIHDCKQEVAGVIEDGCCPCGRGGHGCCHVGEQPG